MSTSVEFLKGSARGKVKAISESRARALERVGFARIVTAEGEPEDPAPVAPAPVDPAPVTPTTVPEPAEVVAETTPAETAVDPDPQPDADETAAETKIEPEPDSDISPRTGKPKRQYRRRDMKAED